MITSLPTAKKTEKNGWDTKCESSFEYGVAKQIKDSIICLVLEKSLNSLKS